MQHIQAPQEYDGERPSVFLAGGVSQCADWQDEMVELLRPTSLVLLNPRRENFPINEPAAAKQQIGWEFRHLRRASAHLFWFGCETLCPIALFELGAWSERSPQLFVGTHPDYQRRLDVETQLRLARPEVGVADNLEALAAQVIAAEIILQKSMTP